MLRDVVRLLLCKIMPLEHVTKFDARIDSNVIYVNYVLISQDCKHSHFLQTRSHAKAKSEGSGQQMTVYRRKIVRVICVTWR